VSCSADPAAIAATELDAAIGEHQSNTDVHALMGRVPFRDDRVAGLDWEATAPAASGPAIASSGVPMLVRAGWLDGGFAAGHDAFCFTRYGPAEETFTLRLGSDSHLGLPVRYG
jgi:uncharacterized protein